MNIKETMKVGRLTTAVYLVLAGLIFVAAIPVTIYQDHARLVKANSKLSARNNLLVDDTKSRDEEIKKLREENLRLSPPKKMPHSCPPIAPPKPLLSTLQQLTAVTKEVGGINTSWMWGVDSCENIGAVSMKTGRTPLLSENKGVATDRDAQFIVCMTHLDDEVSRLMPDIASKIPTAQKNALDRMKLPGGPHMVTPNEERIEIDKLEQIIINSRKGPDFRKPDRSRFSALLTYLEDLERRLRAYPEISAPTK